MFKKFIYHFAKSLAWVNLHLYFSKIEINGRDRVPTGESPIILAVNHQAAFLDAIIAGTLSPLPVNFLTRSDVFKPATQWIFSAFNMIPIYRIRDGFASLSKNEAIFETCKQILLDQKQLLIFPEGNHSENHFLRPITKGISRIALNSQLVNHKDIKVVPVGINYFHHTRSGRKLSLYYGDPINVRDFMPADGDISPKNLNDFRKAVMKGMKECLIIPEEENYNENKFVFSRANEKLTHSKIRELVEQGQNFKRESKNGLAHILSQLLKLPNLPVYLLYHWVEKTKVSQVAFISSIKLVTGMFIFPLWLLLSFIFGGLILGWNIGAYIVVLQVIAVLLRRWIVPYSYATEA